MYVLIETNQVKKYPYGVDTLRRDNPQTSFPSNPSTELLAAFNVFPVKPTDRPIYDTMTHRLDEGVPIMQSDEWLQVWNVVALSADEISNLQQTVEVSIITETQKHLDDFAKTRNYDGILSACTYATSTVLKFKTEGQYCVEARDATWAKLYEILAEVQAGTRPVPSSFSDIEAELPILTWPA